MRPLDFPNYPTPGQVWGRWRWDGVKWTFPPAVPAEPPVGEIIDWPLDDEPDDEWVVMDGRAVERRKYPVLFALIGTRFGAPTPRLFNMPDLRGKMLVGLDPDDTGRISVMDVARLWEEGGSALAGEHDHTAIGGAHAHSLSGDSHTHGISQSLHNHGFHDPWHGHATYQDPHSHGNADPTHNHGKPDPGHSHLQGHVWDLRNALVQYAWYNWVTGGNAGVAHGGIGAWNDGSGVGVNCLGDYASIWCDGAGTGLASHGNVAHLDVYAATCDLTMVTASSGLTEIAENDGGTAGNIQPVLELLKIVRAGGVSGSSDVDFVMPDSPLDFPTNPPAGTVYGAWQWDGVKWGRLAHGLSPAGTRIGTIADWTDWPNVPPRWRIADGRELNRDVYPRLFFVMGTEHGDGDGSTTFNLPDTRARVTVGVDVANVTARLTLTISGIDVETVGAVGGDERVGSHIHPATPLPAHAHELNDAGHVHGVWQVAHGHGTHDPGHAHGFPQNHHGHGQSGGWHGHGHGEGGHGHGQFHGWLQNDSEPWQHWYYAVVFGDMWVEHLGTGVHNWASGNGVWTGGNYAWISVDANWSQQWVDNAWAADLGMWGNATGVTVNNADAATGIVIHENAGDEEMGNIAPSMVLPKLIYVGVDYA